ncbi:Vi polysaccharide biosynthesis UDP-N-acetylglucosamine C-6 dehydrogenase TviB [Halioglobus maricola]|uniref:Vi polysaccharide biosynthesis UDP-N-acetylglucosamine C-6 dehydrogenase TviB n=1 Tax=Halioglobus maricola TaxID=2601894 RepID=A0A5P9NFP1_9GAMM|nr:Vi polysaccharide biosynthesis UDP-N-acetylglucosamine C-6 dehydrogenase TviB [Halioglobus maricola]QFU74623.1 Vi polysaccharide biosynthesis UDP-N-acetylglucosamine C-6 dehydrogenase TviB [Halioglobus maricola]
MQSPKIAIIGLGYVGLPLAVEFGKKYTTIGFDINENRIADLRRGQDKTLEVNSTELNSASELSFTSNSNDLGAANVFIVTVPTPIDRHNRPDLAPLGKASETVGKVLKSGDVVIYESTVYPGATEDYCVPILERESNFEFKRDFHVGYSPERINPGDKEHRLSSIIKVTSGSNEETAGLVDQLYNSIIEAGTHKAESIKVAEAAKVIENTQRDVNIALMNELAMIFDRLNIETDHVLKAAGSKWNFLPFKPGLVGGHCIGVDPYYLTHKAQEIGYHPEIISAGRRINDSMGGYIASQLIKAMLQQKIQVNGARILIMGLTFKENCPDLRNTRVIDVIQELGDYNVTVDVFDPWVDAKIAADEYRINVIDEPRNAIYDGIIIAVAHRQFAKMSAKHIRAYGKEKHVLYDIKNILPNQASDLRL